MKIKSEKRLLMTDEIMQNGIKIEFLEMKLNLRVNAGKLKLDFERIFGNFLKHFEVMNKILIQNMHRNPF